MKRQKLLILRCIFQTEDAETEGCLTGYHSSEQGWTGFAVELQVELAVVLKSWQLAGNLGRWRPRNHHLRLLSSIHLMMNLPDCLKVASGGLRDPLAVGLVPACL